MSSANPLSSSNPGSVASDTAHHEPSMEEILASIRRIIADDQSLPSRSAETAAPRHGVDPSVHILRATYHPDPVALQPEGGDAFRDEGADGNQMMAAHGAVSAPQFATPDGPVAAHDDFAREHPFSGHPDPSDAVAEYGDDVSPHSEVENGAYGDHPGYAGDAQDLTDPVYDERRAETTGMRERPFSVSHQEGAYTESEPLDADAAGDVGTAAHAAFDHRHGGPSWSGRAPHLFSEATDQSVASAFNMLAATRLADNSDELLALARDMIRPLLRTWIDENLPGMVERMVRAEIERVARGGR